MAGLEQQIHELENLQARKQTDFSGELRQLRENYTALLKKTMDKLEHHQFPISELAKTEALSESPDIYREKVKQGKRNPAALYELALASGRSYRAGDQLSYYVTGETKKVKVYESSKLASLHDPVSPDENVPYYQDKLLALVEKFREWTHPPAGLPETAIDRDGLLTNVTLYRLTRTGEGRAFHRGKIVAAFR